MSFPGAYRANASNAGATDRLERSGMLLSARWSTLQLILAGVCVALAGYWIAGKTASSRDVPAAPATFPVSQTSATSVRPPAQLSAAEAWEQQWSKQSSRPNSPARTRDLETMLEQLARTDPQRALALALAEGNWLVRDLLRNAALRGWGATAPDAAADWATAQPLLGDRMQCVTAVLTGAAERPEDAVRLGLRLCAAEAAPAGDYGHALINALVDKTGSFETAARFATAATMVDRQSFLLDSAYYQWAQHEPGRALAEFDKIADPKIRDAARKGMIAGWADSDPQKLADFAQALPRGEDRSRALEIALPQWVAKEPEAALKWMNQVDPDPDFDRGIASLALRSSLHPNPAVAMELTESITNPASRVLTQSNVFYQWAIRDLAAARKYAEATPNREQRAMLLEDLATLEASKRNE
ncbi:MAG TPA: hypothetical protein VHO24_04205 [Opitutaceae bacterium]|nr:hypothetical protein [Opitutaceae bacterium]